MSQPKAHFQNCTFNIHPSVQPETILGNLVVGIDVQSARSNRYELSNNGLTVIDHKTGLMWARNETSSEMKFDAAAKYCADSRLADYSDWRLPTLEELQSIVDRSRYNPAIDTNFFNSRGGWIWSTDEHAARPGPSGSVWVVRFGYGGVSHGGRDSATAFARAVRAVPAGQ